MSVETDYTFPPAEKAKAFLGDPSVFVAATSAGATMPPIAEAKQELEESDEDMRFVLFD